MAGHIIAIVGLVVGGLFVVAVVATIVAVTRNRPAQPTRVHPDPYRVRGRSIRGWQNSAIREIRRAGRQHGKRK
jgi:hypothetical protein